MTGTLLSTGKAAALLGVSRQHVVDLCDRGDLPSIRVGTHRRIPESALSLHIRALSVAELRSYVLHLAVAGQLVDDPERVVGLARRNLEQWKVDHGSKWRAAPYLEQWSAIIDDGVEAILEVFTDRGRHACDLRSASPFAGALDEEQRARALATARAIA